MNCCELGLQNHRAINVQFAALIHHKNIFAGICHKLDRLSKDLGLEVYHSVHYLDKLIQEGRIKFNGDLGKKVTYHDPCDLGRACKIFEEPRNILKKIPGLEYVEMARNRLMARCCGGGGGVQANNPEMAVEMAAERVRDALAVGAEIIVSGCAACKDNLRKGARAIPKQERGKIKIMDITEIVAKAIE